MTFEYRNIKEIRQEDEYGGYRISLDAKFDKLVVPMKLDITTGDVIVPKEVSYKFDLMFENRSIEILAYNMETVIADKIEVIKESNVLKEHWKNYQSKFSYAEDISYEDIMGILEEIMIGLLLEK